MEKPKPRFTTFRRIEGCYDLLHPKDVSAQYIFEWAPEEEPELKKSYLVQIDHDWEATPFRQTALELARDLVVHFDTHYLYTRQLADAKALVEYLEARQEAEEAAMMEYDVEHAKYQVEHWLGKLRKAQQRLEDYHRWVGEIAEEA